MFFFFSSRRRHTRFDCDWSSDVCSSDLLSERRRLMKSLLKLRSGRIRICDQYNVSATDMLAAARQQQLEGVVAKRSEEHTSELQSQSNLVCRLLLEK